MKIGIATTDFTPMPMETLLGRARDYGNTCLQLSFDSFLECGSGPDGNIEMVDSYDAAFLRRLRARLESLELQVVAVNGIFNGAHPDASVREEGLRRFALLAEVVGEIGCGIISLSSGSRNPAQVWQGHPDNTTEAAWADSRDTMKKLAGIAEKHGLTLAIETEAANVVDTPERARRMMDEVGSKRLKMIMDCANLFHEGEAQPGNVGPRMREAFAAYGRDVVVAHGKDIRAGEGIDFCAAGEGIVDFPLFFSLLREYGYAGEMILHGIYDEAKMPGCLEFVRGVMEA